MEKISGDEFSFPVTKTPLLESKILALPLEIKNLEVLIYKTESKQTENNIRIEKIKKEVINEVSVEQHSNLITRTDEEFHEKIMEKLRSNTEYQILIEKHNNTEEIIELDIIELRYLNNLFAAYKAISRMI